MGECIRHILRRKDKVHQTKVLPTNIQTQIANGQLDILATLQTFAKEDHLYDYDLIVIGGGSGGLSCAKQAAQAGAKVALFDFVKPTPIGTTWGLGGTCVNVGCIPKKLMHTAAQMGDFIHDSSAYGWKVEDEHQYGHDWDTMKVAVQDHIGSQNWGYRMSLRDSNVEYLNSYAKFLDPHTLEGRDRRGKIRIVTGNSILLAMGLRPKYPDVPGAKEYGITSDDLFSLDYSPGKTLLVGASYVSLECGGFLHGLGYDVTVMVRSILLRGFDQEMAERIGEHMESIGIKFVRPAVPTRIELIEKGKPGRVRVTARYTNGEKAGEEIVEEYNTVVWAMGREPAYGDVNLEAAGVKLNPSNNKVIINDDEQTNVPHIYAIGDIGDGNPELTPVAIQAGKLLARRLFGGSKEKMDYDNVPTTVFTPIEYGCCGLSEEEAISRHGSDNIEIYHSLLAPLEWSVPHRETGTDPCYLKLICLRHHKDKVIGLHYFGPNAGEVTQGFGLAMKCGVSKKHFDDCVGIHPTNAEVFTVLEVTKRSGQPLTRSSC